MAVSDQLVAQLEAYLDGLLPPQERGAFEQRIADDAELRDALEQQRKVEHSLRRLISSPSASVVASMVAEIRDSAALDGEELIKRSLDRVFMPPPAETPKLVLQEIRALQTSSNGMVETGGNVRAERRETLASQAAPPAFGRGAAGPYRLGGTFRYGAVAALWVIALLAAAWAGWTVYNSSAPPSQLAAKLTIDEYYSKKVKHWVPYWVCENDEQFASSFRDRFGQALLLPLASMPAGVSAQGLDYCHTITPSTVAV